MESEINDFITNSTTTGESPADPFVEAFLTSTGRLHTHDNKVEVRYWLTSLGLLLGGGRDSGGRVLKALGGNLPVHPITGQRYARG
jgi:hypothetical protein